MNYGEQDSIVALKGGDIGGLEALVAIYQLRAIRTAFAITGDRHVAEDVVADAFLVLYNAGDWSSLSKTQKNNVNQWMSTFDSYNNGLIGPGHCN